MADSSEGNADDEALEFDASAGHAYVIVVDGWDDATSDFSLTRHVGLGRETAAVLFSSFASRADFVSLTADGHQ